MKKRQRRKNGARPRQVLPAAGAVAIALVAILSRTHHTAIAATRSVHVPRPEVATAPLSIVVRGHPVASELPDPALVPSYLALLRQELRRFPPGALGSLQLKRIVVANKLTSGGISFDAMADWDAHILYLTALDPTREEHHARIVVHHEAYHLLDQAETGDLANDPTWSALNLPGFAYGSGGDGMRQLGAGDVGSTDTAGFVSRYATTGVDEDKAETYAHLMIDHGWVLERATHDAILARKLDMLRARLNQYVPGWGNAV